MSYPAKDAALQIMSYYIFSEGVYRVKVTAVNPLGNMTFEMSRPFYVQEPPRTLVFHEGRQFKSFLSAYAAKVGEKIEFTARVLSGTNVTYDWKMGDQTDIVKAGKFPVLTSSRWWRLLLSAANI